MALMAVSKDDIQRAKCIMDSMVSELGDSLDVGEQEREKLLAVQSMLDILQSPLFTAVVDIRDQFKKHVQESESWNEAADVKVMDTADVVAQFKDRYKITSDEGVVSTGSRKSSTFATLPERLLDDVSVSTSQESPQHVGFSSHLLNEECRSTLNKQHQRSPSVSSTESRSSAGSKKKMRKRRGKCVTLGQLAQSSAPPGEIPLKTVSALSVERNSEVSLSSLSSEVTLPPLPLPSSPDIFTTPYSSSPTTTTVPSSDEEKACKDNHPKDVLFFMRDKKSMTDVRAALNGRWGRGQREVRVSCKADNIGLELCGLSTTGVFVSKVSESSFEHVLQSGDEILEVDGCAIRNMAWFEVQQLLKNRNSEIENEKTDLKSLEKIEEENVHLLLVQYNPAGMGEIKRHEIKTMARN